MLITVWRCSYLTETDKVAIVAYGIGVSVKYKHLRTVLFKPFLPVSELVSVSVSVNTP